MITRSQMRRQLRAQGGIMNVAPREKFGLGSKIKERLRKLIPNEVADVAVKAAPFIAPFYPGYAAIARGLGRFDQRGSISDALKQGAATYVGGEGARRLGGLDPFTSGNPFSANTPAGSQFSMDNFKERGAGRLFKGGEEVLKKKPLGTPKTEGVDIIQKGADKVFGKVPILKDLPPMVKQKLLVGGITGGASALYSYFTGGFEPQQPGETTGEYMARRNTRVKQQMRGYMDSYYTPLRNPQYAAMSDEEKDNYIDSLVGQTSLEGTTDYQGEAKASGGRVGLMGGSMPMGEPRVNQGGITELDFRAKGGFVPVGIKEKADDVPAMLSKNEFVFTADAVRGAGNGSIENGAQKMYDTMKNLERRVT